MSLLETILKALENQESFSSTSEHSLILDADDAFLKLHPKFELSSLDALAIPVTGWELSSRDSQIIELGKKFSIKVQRKLKTKGFGRDEFLEILIPFLDKIRQIFGISLGTNNQCDTEILVLLQKVGSLIGRDALRLVLEASVKLELWDFVEVLIVNDLIDHSCYPFLLANVLDKQRSDLVCLAVKHASDFREAELLSVLKYFLCPKKDAFDSMMDIRKEWQRQAKMAIGIVRDDNLKDKKTCIAKDASILLMVAHDGFSTWELCLHYLVATQSIDDVILSSCIRKLNGKELMNLVRYFGKWLRKYENFPQAIPCPKAAPLLNLKECDWVPKLVDVIRWVALVLDESFTTVVLHSEFHEELRAMTTLVETLAWEAKQFCFFSNVIESLRTQVRSEQV